MMKTVLIGINAKYIHSNLAIRCLKEYALRWHSLSIELQEFTINQHIPDILAQLYRTKPDILGFSCYLWNYEMVKRLTQELKKILPKTVIFLGGPEVTFHPKEVLETTSADFVLMGEGEKSCSLLIQALEQGGDFHHIPGIAFWENGSVVIRSGDAPLEMDTIPFVYEKETMADLEHKILYYESTRGCPFQCQYCLSGHGEKVRFRSLEQVFEHLDFFLNNRVRQVKFVDRTFNCRKDYALAIWRYLKEHDNGYTNFHFEIAAELLDEEILNFLSTVRKGYFQFEIGVQSTHPLTLEHIKRRTDLTLLRSIVDRLKSGGNIHLHLDLIIGLPYESYQQFQTSFNDVYSLHPDQLQVGFLKLLRGSGLYENREKYGIVSSDWAPYEVLYTPWLSYEDLLRLKGVEEMVEVYYNSNRFQKLLSYLMEFFSSPFAFFQSLAEYYIQNGLHEKAHSQVEYYTILFEFSKSLPGWDETRFQWLAKFDLYSHEKAKKLPSWLTVSQNDIYKNRIFDFYDDRENRDQYLREYPPMDTKQLIRMAHIEVFPFDPDTENPGDTPVLFNYQNCDILGNAHHEIISLPPEQERRSL
ncbi:MAG: B12-binding domain-containing radical SAM protein [Massiliimalia sp.]|jgi:radical SAM superfamily enzyme YgiQ (UPF0313 family)